MCFLNAFVYDVIDVGSVEFMIYQTLDKCVCEKRQDMKFSGFSRFMFVIYP